MVKRRRHTVIEALVKAVEQAPAFSKTAKAFNPDVRLASPEKNALQKTDSRKMQSDFQKYDPDRRIESPQGLQEKEADRYNPDKRIEQQHENEKSVENVNKNNYTDNNENIKNETETRQSGLTDEEKKELKEETGWSDEIIDAIHSKEEAEIYKKAGLKEAEINGKKCLIRDDIDMDQKDELGRTNKERMENGLSPITKTGETVELHHIGQKADSPLAELTTQEHRGKGNDTILHDKQKTSEIDREAFKTEREEHWESRAHEADKQGV